MTKNCKLDLKNEIKIPQNKESFYQIEKSKEWKNSIDIKIKQEEKNIVNLFMILKSYSKNLEFFCFKIMSIIEKKEEKETLITENFHINFIQKASIIDFENWFISRINYDKKYISKIEDLHGFRICFQKDIIKGLDLKYEKDVLKYLKPIYPWSKEIIEENKMMMVEKEKNEIKIKNLEEEIRFLKKELDRKK
jgi:hypothetical protein